MLTIWIRRRCMSSSRPSCGAPSRRAPTGHVIPSPVRARCRKSTAWPRGNRPARAGHPQGRGADHHHHGPGNIRQARGSNLEHVSNSCVKARARIELGDDLLAIGSPLPGGAYSAGLTGKWLRPVRVRPLRFLVQCLRAITGVTLHLLRGHWCSPVPGAMLLPARPAAVAAVLRGRTGPAGASGPLSGPLACGPRAAGRSRQCPEGAIRALPGGVTVVHCERQTSLTANACAWHARPMGFPATLMLAPGCSPWRAAVGVDDFPRCRHGRWRRGRHAARE